MPRPFDLITFDFDGVLLHSTANEVLLSCFRQAGLRWPAERERDLQRFIHEYYGTGLAREDRRTHEGDALWTVANRRFARVLHAEPWADAMGATINELFALTPRTHYHETGIHALLHRLRGRGYVLAMLTNRDDKILDFAAPWDLIRHFDFIGTQSTVGTLKPDPALFHHIADRYAIAPQRALHIGDNPYADVVGARAAGWHALLIDPDDLFPDWDVPRLPVLRDLPEWLERAGAVAE